jgi:hypothetical protein
MIDSWVLFPLVLAAVGLGWGSLVEWPGGRRGGALTIPLGLAAAIVAASLLTQFSASAPAAVPVVGAIGGLGLLRAWRHARVPAPAVAAAVGVLAIYGAPVILSGQATFLGYVRLDDTATWFAFVDQFFAHGRALGSLPSSTYQTLLQTNLVQGGYPPGAFMLPGIGHGLTGIDVAWLFQPDMAVCAGAMAMCMWELLDGVVESRWLRSFVAFIAAQSALLVGYAAWGGIKEVTGAFLLALGLAVTARALPAGRLARADGAAVAAPVQQPEGPSLRDGIAIAVVGAALIDTFGVGAGFYVAPVLLVVAAAWCVAARRGFAELGRELRGGRTAAAVARVRRHGGVLVAVPLTAALMLPAWLTLSAYLHNNGVFTSSGSGSATAYGNLTSPLRALQLSGIWLDGDFRSYPGPPSPAALNDLLIWMVFAGAVLAVGLTLRRRLWGLPLYAGVAVFAIVVLSLIGTVPWIMGKSLAISSPAVLLAGMAGGAILISSRRALPALAGVLVLGGIAGGVLWSNYLQYRNVTLAPRTRLAELAHVGSLLDGRAPTFLNEYEIYGTRHFLRQGAPVSPAEYRPVNLPTLGNALLDKPAWANIDAFGLATLRAYPSLVERVSPTESLPPSIYRPVYLGRYYQLWQQPAHPSLTVLLHYPLGDSTSDAYCGNAENVTPSYSPLCPIAPASVPQCSQVGALARTAQRDHAVLRAYERTNPIVVRGTTMHASAAGWSADPSSGILTATAGGATASVEFHIPYGVKGWQLWLGGSFARGFDVTVDGRPVGSVVDQLDPIGAYERVGAPLTLAPGNHTFRVTYRGDDLSPGGAQDEPDYTQIWELALAPPLYPSTAAARMLTVTPAHATRLCGKSLDWIEVVRA